MSDNSTQPLTEKELREIYSTFSKEKLIDAIVQRHLQVRTLHEEMARLIHK